VQLKLKNFPTHLQPKIVNKKKNKKETGEQKKGKRRKSEPCTDFFFMSGQCKLCALIGGQRNFSHTKEQIRCPPILILIRSPKPFLPCATLAPRIPPDMFAMSPDFSGRGLCSCSCRRSCSRNYFD